MSLITISVDAERILKQTRKRCVGFIYLAACRVLHGFLVGDIINCFILILANLRLIS